VAKCAERIILAKRPRPALPPVGLQKKRHIGSNRRRAVLRSFLQVAAMAEVPPNPPPSPVAADSERSAVRVEVRHGSARSAAYDLRDAAFLIGSVPGCDLRLPGANLPPVLCVITHDAGRLVLRKLAPAYPVLLNGNSIATTTLSDGDRVVLGAVDLHFHLDATSQPSSPVPQAQDERERSLVKRERELEEQTRELETDRVIWYRRRDEVEQECRQKHTALEALEQRLQEREAEVASVRADLDQRAATQSARDFDVREEALACQKQELDAVRQELNVIRQQLYDRYRERRDRLAGLQEAVNVAARKVQEQKRSVEAEAAQLAEVRRELEVRAAALDAPTRELVQAREALAEEHRHLELALQQREAELAVRLSEYEQREQRLQQAQQALEKGQARHQADLVRLDRREAFLEERQKQMQERARDVDRRFEQLQRDTRDLEEQARGLDEWHTQLRADAERIAGHDAELEPRRIEIDRRAAALEGQQAMLATLRSRLERMREEVRRETQLLTEQRTRQEAAELELEQRLQEAERLRVELDTERQAHEQERHRFEDRGSLIDTAVSRLRDSQEKLSAEETALCRRVTEFDARASEQAEQVALVQARSIQLTEWQQRLDAERTALREREAALTRAEQTRVALQEQLQRRSDELAARQRALADQARRHDESTAGHHTQLAEIEERRAELERARQQDEQRFAVRLQEIETMRAELDARQQHLEALQQKVQEMGRLVAAGRKALHAELNRCTTEQQVIVQTAEQRRVELEVSQREAQAMQAQWPDLEQKGRTAIERLAEAREQLRVSLAELHAYAKQGRDDLEELRQLAQADADQVRQQDQALNRARDEQRLAVAAFRQHIIEWQGQVAEMKRSLARGEADLERRQAEVDEQARKMSATSERLAKQAEHLEEQERQVVQRREEVEGHLADMREWYRKKLRELALGRRDPPVPAPVPLLLPDLTAAGGTGAEGETVGQGHARGQGHEGERQILALTGDVEPADRQLGDLLRSLELVDADTLSALLVEARRQRRSLRQVLLAGNFLTLYQLALIEAGNLDALVLGPTRVIDRLRATPHETVYRVFDPRRGRDVMLRHLAETDALDAVRPDEFRQRFAAAGTVQHPHVAAVLEVIDVAGRPAVLQEWLSGVPSNDWPPLAAVPGVWFRLLCQAALGLQTAHDAGLVHGHLHADRILLLPDGTVKLCGFGEPPWLIDRPSDAAEPLPESLTEDAANDLAMLGRIAAGWADAARRKGARAKPLPESLQTILARLDPNAGDQRLTSALSLLEALDQAGADVPANGEAWDRLLRHVREHAPADAVLRRSA
jgi:chromosome segregation ATPase